MTTYKTLNGHIGAYGYGDYTGYLPTKRPGKWLPKVTPILCRSGYHVCAELEQLVRHLGEDIYEVEVRGESDRGDDKSAHEQMRLLRRVYADTWTPETQRLFAADCARIGTRRQISGSCCTPDLDVVVGDTLGHRDAARAAYDAARDAYAAAYDAYDARAAARDAAYTEQTALLARYLAGEQGPFVEEGER